MSKNLDLVKYYFNVSNKSNFLEIEKLFTSHTTYSSQNTGLYLGVKDIMNMQEKFHHSFEQLKWHIVELNEIKSGIFKIDFNFEGVKLTGEKINFSGLEYIICFNNKILYIEIKNK